MFNKIKAGLKIAEEVAPVVPTTPEKDVPIQPFKGVGENAPKGFEFEKYKLTQPDDLRKFKPTLDKLEDRSEKIKDIDKKAKEMRVEIEEKIKTMQGKEGYEKVKTEMTEAAQKVNDELIPYFKEAGNTLMAYKNTVFTVIDSLKADPVTESEKKAKLLEALNKFMAPEISGKVIETFDAMLVEFAKSAEKIKQVKELRVWHPSKDLRKQIEKEVPKGASLKTADIGDMVSKFVGFLKGLWDSLSEKVGNFFAAKEQADPIIDEMNALLAETPETQASKDMIAIKAGLKVAAPKNDWTNPKYKDIGFSFKVTVNLRSINEITPKEVKTIGKAMEGIVIEKVSTIKSYAEIEGFPVENIETDAMVLHLEQSY